MSRHGGRDDDGFRDNYYGVDSRPSSYHLQPPPLSQQRPRSVPPPSAAVVERSYMMTPATRSNSRTRSRGRNRSRSCSRSRSHSRSRSRRRGARGSHSRGRDGPVEKAEKAVKNSFTSSNSGLGIGILGAIVGGLAARHASDSAPKHRHPSGSGHHSSGSGSSDRERDQRMLMSTLVGAAVGGLGANALERRLEINREKEDEARGRAHHHHHHHHHRHHDDPHHHHHSHHRRHHHSHHDGVDHVYDYVYDDERPVRRRRSLDDPERRQHRPLDYRS
ncbi:hypothetical protein RB595_004541 [Gaeumannomyces hyphopodioides]